MPVCSTLAHRSRLLVGHSRVVVSSRRISVATVPLHYCCMGHGACSLVTASVSSVLRAYLLRVALKEEA